MTEENTVKNGNTIGLFLGALSDAKNIEHVPGLLLRIMREGMWKRWYYDRIKKDVVCDTFPQFVTAMPPNGLGLKIETVRKLIKDDLECLTMFDEMMAGEPGNPNGRDEKGKYRPNSDNITNWEEPPAERGTSRAYTLRRLKKNNPDLYQQVLDKKKTPNQAAIEAGFRKKTISVPVSVDGAVKLLKMFSDEDLEMIFNEFNKG